MPAKHRAPATSRLRSTLVATTTGPLALAALGTLVAPAAQAAPSVDWDAVAQCESSGDWSANTGNGFSGGLQFTRSTWKAFGGSGDAKDASREQQIAVAERVLDGQGIGAWPVCGKKGLGGSTSKPSSSSASSESSSEPATSTKASKASKASSKSSTSSSGSSESGGRHRAPAKASGGYTVAAGDTLGSIASAHGVSGGWQALASANRDVATDPNMIFPGQQLSLPG